MAKFSKQYFYNKTNNEMKVYSYNLSIPKKIVEEANLENSQVKIELRNNEIIIKKDIDKQ